jgi:hypothetical protein
MPLWLRRTLFVAVLFIVSFIEGFILIHVSVEWLIIAAVITCILVVGWMKSYWNG